jgi:Peptidase family S41
LHASTTFFLEIAMKRAFVQTVCALIGFSSVLLVISPPVMAQVLTRSPLSGVGALTEAQAQSDVRLAKRALIELHPALTKYNSPAEMDAAFARFEARGNAARSATELYLAATELAAAIRCGHTWTNTLNQGGAVKGALLESKNKLPLQLVTEEGRWLVIASADSAVQRGDEILSINGHAAADVIKMMMPYLRADGSSDNKRLRQLNHDRAATSMMDLVWPLLSPPVAGRYELRVRRADGRAVGVSVAAMTLGERRGLLKAQGFVERDDSAASEAANVWTLELRDGVAVMRLPTFSFWRSKFNWNQWLDDAFARLAKEGVAHLIIDIRDNEGGDGAINRAILSYLLKAPLTWPESQSISAYERAPYALVKHVDTWDYGFFDRTGKVEKLGERRYRVAPKTQSDRTIKPKSQVFSGKSYLLIGGENSSATFQLAYLAKLSGAATLIGQRTGGNLRGLNGGEIAWVTLPNSGVAIDIPLLAANPIEPQPDTGVTPDVVVQRSFASLAVGSDLEIDAVMKLIATARERPSQSPKQ